MLTYVRAPRGVVILTIGMTLLLALTGCGGTPTPTDPSGVVKVAGTVELPAGSGLTLASLSVSTPIGVYPVSAGGAFEAEVFAGASTEVGVEDAGGGLVLLGVTYGASVAISSTSTAEALLYYLIGAMWLPPEHQDKARSLLRGVPEVADIAAELARQLAAGGNGMTDPDAGLLAALETAHASLLGDVSLRRLAEAAVSGALAGRGSGPTLVPAAVDGSNIVIEPGSATQAGLQILHNPSGAGVVAQNEFRRPVALLVYETGWEDADGALTENDPPIPVDTIDVPATGQLEFLNALIDVVTGASPWSPVLSPNTNLPGHEGASRTHYRLVLVGASGTDTTWPIMEDPRFDIFHGHWEDVELEKTTELFLDELLLPLVEVFGLGSLAKFDAAKLASTRARVKLIHDQHLAGLGVVLRNRQTGMVNGLKYAIQELLDNRNLRLDMVNLIRDALTESDRNKVAIDALEKRLSSRASASAIAAAVQTLLVSGDVAKIMHDLAGSPAVVDWTAVSAPSLFALTPERVVVTRHNASARFTVVPKGATTGDFLYRWRTSGDFGELSDLLQDGLTIDTDSSEIWYFHDTPESIQDTDVDTISVEVYEVEPGATSIPPGASPVARMAAEVKGDDRDIDSRIVVSFGATPAESSNPRMSRGCAEMYLRFDPVPGAKSYTVHARGVGGQGDQRNPNQDFRLNGPNQSVFIDPAAQWIGSVVETGYAADWNGVCTWKVKGQWAAQPHTFSAFVDPDSGKFLVHLFTNVDWSDIGLPIDLGERVELWYQWVEEASFEVVVHR